MFVSIFLMTLLATPPNSPSVNSTSVEPRVVIESPQAAQVKQLLRRYDAKDRALFRSQMLKGKNGKAQVMLLRLAVGAESIRDRGLPMTTSYKIRLAKAAYAAYKKTGVDPFLMLAIGRMESDFRPLIMLSAQCQGSTPWHKKQFCTGDCGITQHHVYGYWKYVVPLCRRLQHDFTMSFLKSAKEIAHHIDWCKKIHNDNQHWRCVLNRYNQGPMYRTIQRCKRPYYASRRWKCVARAIYWKKVLCFKYGAVHQKSPVVMRKNRTRIDQCRYFYHRWKVTDIPRLYRRSTSRQASR